MRACAPRYPDEDSDPTMAARSETGYVSDKGDKSECQKRLSLKSS